MERDRFDTLTRVFAKSGSRRAALGALLGAGLLGTGLDALARKGNGKSKRKTRGGAGKKRGNNRKGVKASGQGNGKGNLGNSVCAKWCHDTFDGKEAGQCTAAAAKGEGPCYECGGPQADPDAGCCETTEDCCGNQVCNTETNRCVVPCGDENCDPDTQKCCTNVGSSDGPVCIAYDECCTVGRLDVCLPNTNEENDTENLPHVELVSATATSVTLDFVNDTNSLAFFEFRIDGEKDNCRNPHPVITGDVIYPGVSVDSRGIPTPVVVQRTFDANEFVEVRLALGGERDWDWSRDHGSGWTQFNVGA